MASILNAGKNIICKKRSIGMSGICQGWNLFVVDSVRVALPSLPGMTLPMAVAR
jgi:hypothetical protein